VWGHFGGKFTQCIIGVSHEETTNLSLGESSSFTHGPEDDSPSTEWEEQKPWQRINAKTEERKYGKGQFDVQEKAARKQRSLNYILEGLSEYWKILSLKVAWSDTFILESLLCSHGGKSIGRTGNRGMNLSGRGTVRSIF
jgi:hypothetical protein